MQKKFEPGVRLYLVKLTGEASKKCNLHSCIPVESAYNRTRFSKQPEKNEHSRSCQP